MKLCTTPFLRIYQTNNQELWYLDNLYLKKSYQLNITLLVPIILAMSDPIEEEQLEKSLELYLSNKSNIDCKKYLSLLKEKEIIIEADEAKKIQDKNLNLEKFFNQGWLESALHIIATQDYPFLDYERGKGFRDEFSIMQKRFSENSEPCRYKNYPEKNLKNYDLESLDNIFLETKITEKSFKNPIVNFKQKNKLDSKKLGEIISLSLAEVIRLSKNILT